MHTVLQQQIGTIIYILYCSNRLEPLYAYCTVAIDWNHFMHTVLQQQIGTIICIQYCSNGLEPAYAYCTVQQQIGTIIYILYCSNGLEPLYAYCTVAIDWNHYMYAYSTVAKCRLEPLYACCTVAIDWNQYMHTVLQQQIVTFIRMLQVYRLPHQIPNTKYIFKVLFSNF